MMKKFKIVFIISLCALIIFSCTTVCNASASSKSFGDYAFSSAYDCVDFSIYGFKELGYYPRYRCYGDINVVNDIMPWINNTGNGYAFYIQIHGDTDIMIDSDCNTIEPYEITGNWDLVFLDFSNSGATSNFAYAFKTIGYDNRGFIGWDDEIYTTEARTFGYYFWCEEVTTTNLQYATIYASSSTGGFNSAPSTYYGDPDYYGYAR